MQYTRKIQEEAYKVQTAIFENEPVDGKEFTRLMNEDFNVSAVTIDLIEEAFDAINFEIDLNMEWYPHFDVGNGPDTFFENMAKVITANAYKVSDEAATKKGSVRNAAITKIINIDSFKQTWNELMDDKLAQG